MPLLILFVKCYDMGKAKKIISDERRTGDLAGMGAVMAPLAKKMLGRKAFAEADVIASWKEIVGEDTAAFSLPVRVDFKKGERTGGVLFVEVASGAFALEMQLKSRLVIDKVNTFFGYEAVQRLKILQNPAVVSQQPLYKPEKKLVTAAEENYIRKMSEDIKHPELCSAVQDLGRAIMSNNKSDM